MPTKYDRTTLPIAADRVHEASTDELLDNHVSSLHFLLGRWCAFVEWDDKNPKRTSKCASADGTTARSAIIAAILAAKEPFKQPVAGTVARNAVQHVSTPDEDGVVVVPDDNADLFA